MAISHIKSNIIADMTGTVTVFDSVGSTQTVEASNLVRPSDWNSVHNQYLTIGGNTAGQSTFSGTNIVIGGGQSITLSGVNATSFDIVGATALTSQSNQNITAGNGGFAFETLSFSNLNGISFGTSAGSAITASHNGLTSQSNQAVSGQNGSSTFQTLSFGNANGISFGTDAGGLTASHNALTSQSNQNVTAGNGGFAFQTLSFSNVNGFSFGTSAGSAITGSYTVPTVTNSSWTVSDNATSGSVARLAFTNLNGVTLSLSSGAGGSHTIVGSHNALTSQSNQAFSAAGGSSAFQTLSFSDNAQASWTNNAGAVALTEVRASLFAVSNTTQSSSGTQNIDALSFAGAGGVSVGVTGGTVVISAAAGGGGTTNQTGPNIGVSNLGNTAGSTGTVSTGNVVLVGSQGITRSQSTGAVGSDATISILGPAPGSYFIPPWFQGGGSNFWHATQDPGNGSIRVFPMSIGHDVVFSKFLASVSLLISTSTNSSHGGTISIGFGIYTRNVSTLSLISSGLGTYAWTNTSNNSTVLLAGAREVSGTFGAMTLTPGDYWFGIWSRTSTVNANWFTASNLYAQTGGTNSTHSGNFMAAAVVASFQPGIPGNGTFSATSAALPASMAFSHITGSARFFLRPHFAFRNFNP